MKPLLVTKSDPTILIAVDRLPEKTSPETCSKRRRRQVDNVDHSSENFKRSKKKKKKI